MATPSLAMIPSAYADSKVYSVLPNNGDGDFTFNRDSSATRVGQNGLIQTVGFFGNELITNGSFATDSDWTKQAGWTISGGTANSDGTANFALNQYLSIPTGTLRIKFDVTARTQGSVRLFIDKPVFTELLNESAIGSYEVDVDTTSNTGRIWFYSTSNFIGSIDNVSVVEIQGDQPRLNYDISNGVVQSCPSLLLEPASTNLITYSEDFSNAAWTKSGLSIVADATISPDGSLNADKLVEDTSTALHYCLRTFPVTSGVTYTYSIIAKYNGRLLQLSSSTAFPSSHINYDLQNGTLVIGSGAATGTIEKLTNGYYRCTYTDVANATSASGLIIPLLSNSTTAIKNPSYTGDGLSGIFMWGAQAEALSYSTSLIPTNGSSQTRAAETCFGAGTASTFNSTEGVLYAEIAGLSNPVESPKNITISDGTASNYVRIEYYQDGRVYGNVYDGASVAASFVVNQTNFNKIAIQYSSSGSKLYVNGTGVDFASKIFTSNTLNTIQFSSAAANSNYFYGKVKDIRVYNEALTDAQLQTLTTL